MADTADSFFLEHRQQQELRRRRRIQVVITVTVVVIGGVPLGAFCLVQWFPQVFTSVAGWFQQIF